MWTWSRRGRPGSEMPSPAAPRGPPTSCGACPPRDLHQGVISAKKATNKFIGGLESVEKWRALSFKWQHQNCSKGKKHVTLHQMVLRKIVVLFERR